ncbi:MAG: hypothetical protein ACLFU4_00925, partial [Opitutales bacterium]
LLPDQKPVDPAADQREQQDTRSERTRNEAQAEDKIKKRMAFKGARGGPLPELSALKPPIRQAGTGNDWKVAWISPALDSE